MPLTLGAITLPEDMTWTDEFAWTPVGQVSTITLSGALVIEEAAQLAGRPITLTSGPTGSVTWGLATRAVVEALRTLADTPSETPMTLTLQDEREFSVRFRRGDGPEIEATPIRVVHPPAADDLYYLTVRLMQV